eukprot:COSAG02_NODE_219_length_28538_cov_79.322058_24_plen_123_part_00
MMMPSSDRAPNAERVSRNSYTRFANAIVNLQLKFVYAYKHRLVSRERARARAGCRSSCMSVCASRAGAAAAVGGWRAEKFARRPSQFGPLPPLPPGCAKQQHGNGCTQPRNCCTQPRRLMLP